jgi:hypothetical protein
MRILEVRHGTGMHTTRRNDGTHRGRRRHRHDEGRGWKELKLRQTTRNTQEDPTKDLPPAVVTTVEEGDARDVGS